MTEQNPFAQAPPPQPKHQSKENEEFLSLSRQISELLSRLRLMEERYANLRREHQTTSQNMIENHQSLTKQERRLGDQLLALKREMSEMNDQIKMMTGELSDTAKAHELKALEKYVDLWQPMDFLTRKQALELIQESRKLYK